MEYLHNHWSYFFFFFFCKKPDLENFLPYANYQNFFNTAMSDSEQEIDISKSIGLDLGLSSDEEGLYSSESGEDYFQDEIIDSSEEENDDDETADNTNKPQFAQEPKAPKLGDFPALEMSEDEDDSDGYLRNKKRKGFGDDDDDDAFFAKLGATAGGSKKKSIYSFRGLGLSKTICANVARKGFKMATPIQRKTIPVVMEGRDVVGMARTGSGKTAAFVLPMIEKLKVHSARVGARAVILSPSRELAEQTMRVVNDFSRGTDLRTALIVGGYSLEDQFSRIMANPDIIIATPGRFLHLKVEMQLDLRTVEYIVFDEADRLFELGFAEQLNEIIASLASSRQTLLFSATLPTSLVEFAKAGLQDPVLVRLDAETKISDELEMAYFTIKDGEREASLAYILQSVIKMPLASEEQLQYLAQAGEEEDDNPRGGYRANSKPRRFERTKLPSANELPSPHSTIVFTPTKHHVEYIANMLKDLGYAVSYIYGTLDQAARKQQLYQFRAGKTTILVVTDVAARGIDIPVLANVINYSLPSSPKVFVHRVGRTARAGRRGWAYSLIRETDISYLLDLELFLGRKLLLPPQASAGERINYTERLAIGSLPREGLEHCMEEVDSVIKRNYDIQMMKEVAMRGEKLYLKTRGSASQESSKRSKEVLSTSGWDDRHPIFGNETAGAQRDAFLQKLANRRVKDTVFEFKKTQFGSTAELMSRRRKQLAPIQARSMERKQIQFKEKEAGLVHSMDAELFKNDEGKADKSTTTSQKKKQKQKLATEEQLLSAFTETTSKKSKKDFKDPNFYMSHYAPSAVAEERAYSISGNGSGKYFGDAARAATFDLVEEGKDFVQKQGTRWDKKRGKFVNAGSTSSDGQSIKFIRGENGTKLPASYRSGRFDTWKKAHKSGNLRVGSIEMQEGPGSFNRPSSSVATGANGRPIYKHTKIQAPKLADKARDDYHKQRKRVRAALEKGVHVKGKQSIFNGESEIQSVDQMRQARALKQQRKEKNARPSKKRKA